MNFAYLCPIHERHDHHKKRLDTLPNIFYEYGGRNHIYAQNMLLDFAAKQGFDAVKIIHAADHCFHSEGVFEFSYKTDSVIIGNWFSSKDGYLREYYAMLKKDDSDFRLVPRNITDTLTAATMGAAIGTPTNWWLPRSVIENIRFDEKLVYYSDMDFIKQCHKIVNIYNWANAIVQIVEDKDDKTTASHRHRIEEPSNRMVFMEKWG